MMNTGICRKIDDLGRVAIPKQIRRNLNITEGEELEIWVENGNTICLKPLCTKDDDFVSWEWLKQYANGKRFNFASDFVTEAEKKYMENKNG